MPYDTPEGVAQALELFIRHQFQVPPRDDQFTRVVNLWEAGYVDSIGVAEVIAFLEDTFAVTIPPETLFDPDFVHIDGIGRIVHGLRTTSRPDAAPSGQAFATG